MPNGGEHYERLGACPRCESLSIRIRQRRHRRLLWRCRVCNGVFETPRVAEYVIPPGDDGRRYVFAESIPQMERRARRRGRSNPMPAKLIAAAAIVIGLGAIGYFVFMGGAGSGSSGPNQRPISDEFSALAVSQSPIPAAVANTPTPMPTDTPVPTPSHMLQPSDTPTPNGTALLAAEAPTPMPTDTPIPTSTPTSTNTPVPVVSPVLDAESTILGYWSDGTADVEVTATLRNDGTLRLDGVRDITATCIAEDDESRGCREELMLSLPDGFAPASGRFTLRLPMGATTLMLDYGGDEPLPLSVEVPERILGVDPVLWECYADRPQRRVEMEGELFDGCGGWSTKTVEKWLNDVPVKVWATGDAAHLATLETVLTELAPILDLEFEWVDSETEADFKAYVGVDQADATELGFDTDPTSLHYWGFAGATVNGGEATSGYMVIWQLDEDAARSVSDEFRSVTIHEALHALVPIGHSTRPASIMGGSGLSLMSPRDAELIRLNSHPLVRPGMSMDDVRDVIVLTDELLDYPEVGPDDPPNPLDLVWRAYASLVEAGSASFRLSGGWTDRACNHTFGVRRGPIEVAIGDFRLFKDDPALLYLNLHTAQFYVVYSRTHREWTHWQLSPEGAWEKVDGEAVADASSWWLWNGKLHRAVRSVLMDASPKDITLDETPDGNLRIHVVLDETYVNLWEWDPIDKSLDLSLVLDPTTYELVGYTWELHRNSEVHSNPCLTYTEVATDGRLGVEIDVPESIRNQLAASQ